ncbi:LytR/AlgR family response regulator transcription factor [Neolewinella agarilytica]|uniref:Two component transcriptional regulator, LytTR family n=1 Tax=Neolewinella agarilytica TaxID=478744 RepID=A0A1H9MR45_9BACT|nr:LytTR family DNA-binding domain-containing protein [Neolewinella agarilytica]SER26190.1 two component transcriptional regulator, LytTR family [Neolewinella agarilytica]
MRAVAVDDDENMHSLLASLLEHLNAEVDLVGTATTVKDGVRVIQEQKPDLLFLDIELPDGTGFDLLDLLHASDYMIVFISGHGQYGRAALDFQALIYIDKPLRASYLKEALDRARQQFRLRNPQERTDDIEEAGKNFRSGDLPTMYSVSNSDGFYFVPVKDILYFCSANDVVSLYWKGGKPIHKSGRLKRFVEQFESYPEFMQVNRSFLVNLKEVRQISSGPNLVMSDGEIIPVSSQTAQEVRHRLEQL